PCRMVAYPFLPRRGAAEKIFQQQDTPPFSFLHLNTTFDNTSLFDPYHSLPEHRSRQSPIAQIWKTRAEKARGKCVPRPDQASWHTALHESRERGIADKDWALFARFSRCVHHVLTINR